MPPPEAGADGHGEPPIYANLVRERLLVDTFLTLTDTLVRDFDPLEMLSMLTERCVELLGFAAAAVILTDGRADAEVPTMSVAAASSERTRLLEVFAVAIEDGPCMECLRTAHPVVSHDLAADAAHRWPRFAAGAAEAGFRAIHALPMRSREATIGVLTLLHTHPRGLDAADARLGQALADAATIGLLHERAVRNAETLADQLQGALTSRVVIEQAKGVLAALTGTDTDEAFRMLRQHSRTNGLRIAVVARSVVDRSLDPADLIGRPGSARGDASVMAPSRGE